MHSIQRILGLHPPTCTSVSSSVFEAAEQMADHQIGAIAVLAEERLAGIFSERDLMTRVVVLGRNPRHVAVGDVMTRDVVTARPTETRESAVTKMRRAGCRHLPIISQGRMIGMLSMRDLLRDEIEEQGEEIRDLRAYLYQQPPA